MSKPVLRAVIFLRPTRIKQTFFIMFKTLLSPSQFPELRILKTLPVTFELNRGFNTELSYTIHITLLLNLSSQSVQIKLI